MEYVEKAVIGKFLKLIVAIVVTSVASTGVKAPARSRRRDERPKQISQTAWGQMLADPNTADIRSRAGRKFRRRYRVPYPLFQQLVQLCTQHGIFPSTRKSRIPVEFKVLACLRVLGRDSCFDDINELSGNMIGESTCHYIFRQFVLGMQEKLFPEYVKVSQVTDSLCQLNIFRLINIYFRWRRAII